MGMPKINLASLQCPHCAGLAKLTGIARSDEAAGRERLSFECNDCGSFEVLAITEPEGEFATAPRPVLADHALQDLWT